MQSKREVEYRRAGDDEETAVNLTNRFGNNNRVYDPEEYRLHARIERAQLYGRLLGLISVLAGAVIWLIYRLFFGETVPVFEK